MSETTTRELYEDMDDYELHALYCDYHEWLRVGNIGNPLVRAKYLGKLHEINMTLARRYKEEV